MFILEKNTESTDLRIAPNMYLVSSEMRTTFWLTDGRWGFEIVWVYEHIKDISATIIHSVTQLCICQPLIMAAGAHRLSSNRPSLSLADLAIAHLRGTHPTARDHRYFRTSCTIHPVLFRIAAAWVWR